MLEIDSSPIFHCFSSKMSTAIVKADSEATEDGCAAKTSFPEDTETETGINSISTKVMGLLLSGL